LYLISLKGSIYNVNSLQEHSFEGAKDTQTIQLLLSVVMLAHK